MKEIFPGYYRKSESEIKQIWENGLIMFDTNVLLNLYRYSEATRDTLLELISKFKSQIFLPYQAALEYNRNRCEVIAEQEKAYKDFIGKIAQIQKDLQTTNKPPFLTKKVNEQLNKVLEKVSAEVESSITHYSEYLKDDPIYNRISDLFKDKITEATEKDELESIYKEGEERYKNKFPPGFEDEKNKDGVRKYGDLILWKQIIKKAKETNKDIILITDERKSDWWWKLNDGRTIGPRQELIIEIKKEANSNFHMYSSERFLSYGQTFLNEKIDEKALKEIEAMKISEIKEIENQKKVLYAKKTKDNIRAELDNILNQIEETEYVISKMENDILSFHQDTFAKYYEGEKLDDEMPEHYKMLTQEKENLENHKSELHRRLRALRKIYIHLKDK